MQVCKVQIAPIDNTHIIVTWDEHLDARQGPVRTLVEYCERLVGVERCDTSRYSLVITFAEHIRNAQQVVESVAMVFADSNIISLARFLNLEFKVDAFTKPITRVPRKTLTP